MLTENQLRSYLAWTIHGRKPQRRATSPMRKGPPRDAAYLAWIREMPCIACGVEGRSEAAHTGSREPQGIRLLVRPLVLRLPHASVGRVPPRGLSGCTGPSTIGTGFDLRASWRG